MEAAFILAPESEVSVSAREELGIERFLEM